MISNQTISKILETARIEEVVGEFLTLKKRGVNYIGLCPFHNEKTPSFNVSPVRGIYKCFGCGAAGNSVKFMMEHEKYSYPEALRYLAEKYHIEIEETGDREQEKEDEKLKESLYIVNSFAQKHFSDNLFNEDEGKNIGLSYFKERGFLNEAVKKFQLGYALEREDTLTQSAVEKGYQLEILTKAGLTSQKGERTLDFFKGRVLFPIHNLSGKVIGFGGRTLKSDKKIPKYINTPESEIYHKSKILYGIFFAKTAIRKQDECLLVEGYTDMISLSQGGIENVVASSGTSLTTEQVKLIKRLTQNITIVYDGDPAGIKAALRGIDLILEEDMNVKVVMLPEPEDPDSFIRKTGAADFKKYIEQNAKDFILFKTEQLLKDSKNDPVKRAEAIKEVVGSIALIPDTIKRMVFIKECSKLLNMDEQVLVSETNKLKRRKFSKEANVPSRDAEVISPDAQADHNQNAPVLEDGFMLQERDIIRLLLEYGNETLQENVLVSEVILHEMEELQLENEKYKRILTEYRKAIERNEPLDAKHFLNHQDKEVSALAIEILHRPYELSHNWSKKHEITITDRKFILKNDIKSSISRFKLRRLIAMIDDFQKKMKAAENEEEASGYQKKVKKYLEVKKQLADALGTVVVR